MNTKKSGEQNFNFSDMYAQNIGKSECQPGFTFSAYLKKGDSNEATSNSNEFYFENKNLV